MVDPPRWNRAAILVPLLACGALPASSPATVMPAVKPTATAVAKPPALSGPSFDDDVAFLRQHGAVDVLESSSGARVAVSAKYQGRVMTSAVARDARSLGWIHRAFILSGKTGTAFDNYGGEDRFWLGPEGGQYALYFPKGRPFTFGEWRTPAGFQEGEWTVESRSKGAIVLTRAMRVTNYAGFEFELSVRRTVRLLDEAAPTAGVRYVAYATENTVTNTGKRAWTKAQGLPSIWILGMYNPAPDARVVVPFVQNPVQDEAPAIVNDRYFGKVPADRLLVRDRHLVFVCDGAYRSKIGIAADRATETLGSYAESEKLLTVVHYNKPKAAYEYVNSMWEQQANPFSGDVVNAYNDGPTAPGKPSLGGFYEIETSSPAAALAPDQSITHTHRTSHFYGERNVLDPIAQRAFGVTLQAITAP